MLLSPSQPDRTMLQHLFLNSPSEKFALGSVARATPAEQSKRLRQAQSQTSLDKRRFCQRRSHPARRQTPRQTRQACSALRRSNRSACPGKHPPLTPSPRGSSCRTRFQKVSRSRKEEVASDKK